MARRPTAPVRTEQGTPLLVGIFCFWARVEKTIKLRAEAKKKERSLLFFVALSLFCAQGLVLCLGGS